MIAHYLIAPLAVASLAIQVADVKPQGAFPAPLPGSSVPANDPAFPPVNGPVKAAVISAPVLSLPLARRLSLARRSNVHRRLHRRRPSDECMKGLIPLREEAEKRGKLIKAASERHAPPDEACKLIGNFGQAEIKMMKYVESHAAKCGIPPQISEQLKNGHRTPRTCSRRSASWPSKCSKKDLPAPA